MLGVPSVVRWFVLWFGALTLLAFACAGCSRNRLIELERARTLTADLRLQLNKANDASSQAVMATTDEQSVVFASEAETATKSAELDVVALVPLLRRLGFAEEIRGLDEFQSHFAKYRELDKTILALAVENTNLKAQRLSFGPVEEAASSFNEALLAMASKSAPKDRCHAENLAMTAIVAVRESQVLQAPHIAEADAATMTQIEERMATLDARARRALTSLKDLAAPVGDASFAKATSALERFREVSSRIIALSRRNTNVISLDLALREKPVLTAACDKTLQSVQSALANEGSKATR